MRQVKVGPIGVLGALVVGSATATTLNLPEPGYLVIDGAYYGYGQPASPLGKAQLQSNAEGFMFTTALQLGNCERASKKLPLPIPELGELRFRSSDSLQFPGLDGMAVANAAGTPRLQLVACEGATVTLIDSKYGDVSCDARIAFPLRRGACPTLDAADPGFVFFNTFD